MTLVISQTKILTPNPADLAGYPTLPIDNARLAMLLAHCEDAGTGYLMGAKADEPFSWPPRWHDEAGQSVNGVDCSGFFRYSTWFATHGQVTPPDGTSQIKPWLDRMGFKRHPGSDYDAVCGLKDGHLRVCITEREDGHPYGHVWEDRDGLTEESYGGNGPGSRSFATGVLERIVTDIYVLS
jgi:hypothetical protein